MIEMTPPTTSTESVVPEGIRRARAAFLRDFPALMADRKTREKFVCYHLEKLVAVTKTYLRMLDEVIRLNIPRDSWLVFQVTPGDEEYEKVVAVEGEFP